MDLPIRQHTPFFILVVLTPFILRIVFCLQDFELLVQRNPVLDDDTFYYFNIARNVSDGKGFTEDGETPTTGFQLVHQMLCILLTAPFGSDRTAPLHLVLAVQVMLSGVALWLLYDLIRKLLGITEAKIAACLCAWWTLLFRHGNNGMETILVIIGVLVCVRAAYTFLSHPSLRTAMKLGITPGLALLMRIDSLALSLTLCIAMVIFWNRKQLSFRNAFHAIVFILMFSFMALGIIFAMNVSINGRLLPDSGIALRALAIENIERYYGANTLFAFQRVSSVLVANEPYSQFWAPFDFHPKLLVIVTTLVLFLNVGYLIRRREDFSLAFWKVIWICAGYAVVLCLSYLVYAPGYWYFSRYIFPISFLSIIGIAPFLSFIVSVFQGRLRRLEFTVLMSVVSLWYMSDFGMRWVHFMVDPVRKVSSENFRETSFSEAHLCNYHDLGRWLEYHVPPHKRIAMWQGGLATYVSRLSIIHMDGVVNGEALEAWKGHRLDEYMREKNVGLYVDLAAFSPMILEHSKDPDHAFHFIGRSQCKTGDYWDLYEMRK